MSGKSPSLPLLSKWGGSSTVVRVVKMGLGLVVFDLLTQGGTIFQGCWMAVLLNMLMKRMVDKRHLG